LASFISYIQSNKLGCKNDGSIKKTDLTKLQEIFSEQITCLQPLVNAFINLSLIIDDGKTFSINKGRVEAFSKLSQIEQYSLLTISSCCKFSRENLRKQAQLLVNALNSIPETGFSTKDILRLIVLAGTHSEEVSVFGAKSRFSQILEKVSGLQYEQYIQKNILEPCGMTNTNCKFQQTTSKGYDNYNHYYSFPENYALGCGNINSTVLDLFKWNTQLPKGKIIKKKSFKKIISQNYYSYGLIKVSDSIFHAGNTNVFNSYNIYNHKTKTSIIILINRPIYNQNSAQIAEKIKTIFNFQI
jgi:hypothetical protein